MSHLGIKILYSALNAAENVWCERVFAPLPDMEERMADLKNTSGAKFFDPEKQHIFPEMDFHLCLKLNTVPFILRLKKGENGDLDYMEKIDVL